MPVPEGMPTPEQMRAEMEAAGPRARYPVASLQTVAAFDWAVEHARDFGGSPDRVSLGGASAGGNLAAGAAVRLRDRAQADPDAMVPASLALVYPVLHAPLPDANAELVGLLAGLPAALTFPPESTDAINRNYLGEASADEAFAFPGGNDMTGLMRTLIITADRDRLRASGEAFASELAVAGVDVAIVRQRGALHGFLNEIGDPAAESALALLAGAVRVSPSSAEPSASARIDTTGSLG